MKFKVEMLCQKVQRLREGISQDHIDSMLPMLHE